MAVKLRLKRMGSKKRPYYRIVAADSRSPRDGKVIELIGTYNPITTPAEININEELAMKWLKNGAIPTDTVRNLFKTVGLNQKLHSEKNVKKPKVEKPKVEKVEKPKTEPKAETPKKATPKPKAESKAATPKKTPAKPKTPVKKTVKEVK